MTASREGAADAPGPCMRPRRLGTWKGRCPVLTPRPAQCRGGEALAPYEDRVLLILADQGDAPRGVVLQLGEGYRSIGVAVGPPCQAGRHHRGEVAPLGFLALGGQLIDA